MYSALLLVYLFTTIIKGLHVQGPPGALVVQLGSSVLLPCFTQSPLPLEGLQVEWRKTQSEALLNIFQHGETRPELQSHPFRGRVHFFPDEIPKGNFSILLQNVVEDDAGVYRCKLNTVHETGETLLKIKNNEHLVVTGADHTLLASVGDELILNCSVGSNVPIHEIEEVTWKRTDRDMLILLYQDNEIYPDASHESYQGRAEFFVNEIPKGNFSLKLKHVQFEDKGEYMCEVHTSQRSGHTVVILQRIGFSYVHNLILVLCLVVLLLTVGLGVPVFILLRKKAINRTLMRMNMSLIVCPHICMCAAFILWATDGGLIWEVLICTAVSIIRPLLLLKTFPALEHFPMHFATTVKRLTFPIYHTVLTIAICTSFVHNVSWGVLARELILMIMPVAAVTSFIGAIILAGYFLRIHSSVCLEICNVAVLGVFLTQGTKKYEIAIHIASTTAPLNLAILMVLTLQRHYFQRKPFECIHTSLSSYTVTMFSLAQIGIYIIFSFTIGNFTKAWKIVFEAVIYIIAWTAVMFLLRCHKNYEHGCFSQHRGKGYLCCAVVVALLMTGYAAVCLHFISKYLKNEKDYAGYMALTAQIHVLAAVSLFQHPRKLPYLPHIIIYMFGAVGLNIVNPITLTAALILKAEKGAQAIEDLSLIVLPFETVFTLAWLALQIYEVWMRTGNRIRQNFRDEMEDPQVLQEMEAQSAAVTKSSDSSVTEEINGKLLQ